MRSELSFTYFGDPYSWYELNVENELLQTLLL